MRTFLAIYLVIFTALASDPLPVTRTPGGRGSWAGIAGARVPSRTTIFTNLTSSANQAKIQSMLDQCPSNQVVYLAAGTYTINDVLNISRSGVTIRGAGTNTILNFTSGNLFIGSWQPWWALDPGGGTPDHTAARHVNITSGLTQGSTNISIASATGYTVGALIMIDQLNDTNSTVQSCNEGVTGSQWYSAAYPADGQDRAQRQLNRIYDISGTNITLCEPIYLPSWSMSNDPETWIFANYTPTVLSGIESLQVKGRVMIHCSWDCWVTNVMVTCSAACAGSSDLGSLAFYWSGRISATGNYLYDTAAPEDAYGFETRACAAVLFENNMINGYGVPVQFSGTYGSVYAYNAITNVVSGSSFMAQGLLNHGGFPTMTLCEGNTAPSWALDNTDSPSAYNVAHRNFLHGVDQQRVSTGNVQAVQIGATNRFCSVIGNVLGTAGVSYGSFIDGPNCDGDQGERRIYSIGFECAECDMAGYDVVTSNTLVRAYNWDQKNQSIETGGFSSGDIPSSYYLTSKPSFFGALAWPPVDPADPSYSRIWTNIPAAYRFSLGTEPPAATTNSPASPSSLRTVNARVVYLR